MIAAGVWDVAAQWRLWRIDTPLAWVNLETVVAFVVAGVLVGRQRGQHGTAWALTLTGVLRATDFIDYWNTGPFPAFGLMFGAADRIFGAWALLRYPRPRMSTAQRFYLAILAIWVIGGWTLVAVTSTASGNGFPRGV